MFNDVIQTLMSKFSHFITDAVQGNTFLIQVSGTVSFSGETKPFQQAFIITAQSDKWKIVSDNFRMQEPVE